VTLTVGQVYEIRSRIIIEFSGKRTPEREFLRFIGYSSAGKPVFQDGEKFKEVGGEWQDIAELTPTHSQRG